MKKKVTLHKMALLVFLFLFGLLPYVYAQTLPANFQRVQVTASLTNPTAFAFTPDNRILICQQNGQLRVVKNDSLLATPAITLSVNASGERGLIGVALDPNFATNQFIYLHYTHTSGPHNRVSRFTMSGDIAGSELALLDLPNLVATNHNGGSLAFGSDGKLYVAVGDNAVGSNAQNLDTYLGKLLRINADGTVPADNPFTGNAVRSRIWAYGLRNPYSIASDLDSNRIFINDVGNNTWEEINDASTGGRNFGWPTVEGQCTSNCTGFTNPVYFYATNRNSPPPDGQGCAINGGTFFNGAISNYPATYNGSYFFLDYCGGWINYIIPASPTRNAFGTSLGGGLVYLKQGNDGNLYYLSRDASSLYRIIYTATQAPVITAQPQNTTVAQGNTATFSVTASGSPVPTYQWRRNGTNITGATAATYTITNVQPSQAGQYSVVVSNSAGTVTSNNATLTVTAPNTPPVATITAPVNGALFRAGTSINYSGTATDAEDSTLPASAFEWWADFHHANHIHPGPDMPDSVRSGTFPISVAGHIETDIWYRIYLVVHDAQGATDTAYVEIFPVTSTLALQTQPTGLQLRLDDIPLTTPYSTSALSGMQRPLEAPSPQTLNGVTYLFDHWEHGGAASQTITITDSNAVYTAVYQVEPAACDPVTASSNDGNVPANVLDNNLNTRWSANGDGQWIQFCLSDTTTVSGVQIAFYSGTIRRATFDIFTGTDGVNWTTAAAGLQSSGTTNDLQTFAITPRTARYVRIVGHGNTVNTWNSFTEVKIQTTATAQLFTVTDEQHGLPNAGAKTALNSYPNPFSKVNTITFSLNQSGHVQLAVFDVMGKQVAMLVNSNLQAGIHRASFDSQQLAAGIYTLRLIHNGNVLTKKVVKE